MSAADEVAPAIYAMGLCCPLGRTFAGTRDAYRRGDRAFRKERALVGPDGLPPTLATVLPLAECRNYVERLLFLFEAALADACTAAAALTQGPMPLRLVVQPWLEGRAMLATLVSAIRHRHGRVISDVAVVHGGSALGLSSLGDAALDVAKGRAETVLAAVLDSLVHPALIDAIARSKRLHGKFNPYGFIPGEAACVCVLSRHAVQADGLLPLGFVDAVFRGHEHTDDVLAGRSVGRGLGGALAAAAAYRRPDRLLVDLNGERWRAEEMGFALARAGADLAHLGNSLETPALHLGDCGGGMGALMAALALADPPHGSAAGSVSIVSAGSLVGPRATAAIERRERA